MTRATGRDTGAGAGLAGAGGGAGQRDLALLAARRHPRRGPAGITQDRYVAALAELAVGLVDDTREGPAP
jgi:hypothetical protein